MARALYTVVKREFGWFIAFEQELYGPFPAGRTGALIAAVQSAQQAGKDGHQASVRLRSPEGGVRTVWSFGTDPYPPPWADEVRSGLPGQGDARKRRAARPA
ncbi:MAG TPA: hypothetical protein VEB64_07205 [Azospirillaceae bacterium]|nr:hypothetical protein [Azospirillaceae bacterium]